MEQLDVDRKQLRQKLFEIEIAEEQRRTADFIAEEAKNMAKATGVDENTACWAIIRLWNALLDDARNSGTSDKALASEGDAMKNRSANQ